MKHMRRELLRLDDSILGAAMNRARRMNHHFLTFSVVELGIHDAFVKSFDSTFVFHSQI